MPPTQYVEVFNHGFTRIDADLHVFFAGEMRFTACPEQRRRASQDTSYTFVIHYSIFCCYPPCALMTSDLRLVSVVLCLNPLFQSLF